jgi:hypothetical protein
LNNLTAHMPPLTQSQQPLSFAQRFDPSAPPPASQHQRSPD